jgi:hypothetical protein
MKRILITGAGGSPAVNFSRSLRDSKDEFYLIGVDCNKYTLQRAETDERYLIPAASDKNYLPVLKEIIKKTSAEFIHAQNDIELTFISRNRDSLPIRTFLPNKETVEICIDKFKSYQCWKNAKIPQPETRIINNDDDLRSALDVWGEVWLRDTVGAAGKGSLPVSEFKMAKAWLDFKSGWGKYTAAEMLSSQSVTWQSIWKNGELVVAQGRKRLYYEFADRAPSGITGLTGTGVTVSNEEVDQMAIKAIKAITKNPHGIFSVDLTYDKNRSPNPTEINIGRFFTTHHFFTAAGLNMPYILVQLAFEEEVDLPKNHINPLEKDLAWIRGLDFLPKLTTVKEIEQCQIDLEKIIQKIKN